MKEFFSVSETAKIVDMTAETLRHYDRIDLVKPCRVDEWTGYRYYSNQEIVRLNTIKLLRCMGLSLTEIKEILSYDDFSKIVQALKHAEEQADKKIAELNFAKTRIRRARDYYEGKLCGARPSKTPEIKYFPERVILLSDTMEKPASDNLWNYHSHFFSQLPEDLKKDFAFEDMAGVYGENGRQRMFAVCTKYRQTEGLKVLPQGKYLCADCTEETRGQVTEKLVEAAKTQYKTVPSFTLQMVVVTGILQWDYQAQVFISE